MCKYFMRSTPSISHVAIARSHNQCRAKLLRQKKDTQWNTSRPQVQRRSCPIHGAAFPPMTTGCGSDGRMHNGVPYERLRNDVAICKGFSASAYLGHNKRETGS